MERMRFLNKVVFVFILVNSNIDMKQS